MNGRGWEALKHSRFQGKHQVIAMRVGLCAVGNPVLESRACQAALESFLQVEKDRD